MAARARWERSGAISRFQDLVGYRSRVRVQYSSSLPARAARRYASRLPAGIGIPTYGNRLAYRVQFSLLYRLGSVLE